MVEHEHIQRLGILPPNKNLPLLSDAIDVHDVVCLPNSYAGGVRGECKRAHLIASLAQLEHKTHRQM